MQRWLLLCSLAVSACNKGESTHFSPPVGVHLTVAGIPVEAALAVTSPEEPAPLVPKIAEYLSAALPSCADAQAILHAGQVLRFTLQSKQGTVFGAAPGNDTAAACLTRAAIGRSVGSPATMNVLLELREKPQ